MRSKSRIADPKQFERYLEIRNGELLATTVEKKAASEQQVEVAASASEDQEAKIRIISRIPQLLGLETEHIRLLAYGAQWVRYESGDYVYRSGDSADGAYIFTQGTAELWMPETASHEASLISDIVPGQIVGDLSVVMQRNRRFDLKAATDLTGLRIGTREFLDVIEHDHVAALNLLKSVSDHLLDVRDRW